MLELQVTEFTNEEVAGVPPLFDEEAQPKEPEKVGREVVGMGAGGKGAAVAVPAKAVVEQACF